MPKNKLPYYRYKLLDKCFRRPGGCTMKEMIRYVSDKLYEDFGVESVSERTLRYDISFMRSDPPRGFGAPIIYQNGRYKYKNPDFTISKINLHVWEVEEILTLFEQIFESMDKTNHVTDKKKISGKPVPFSVTPEFRRMLNGMFYLFLRILPYEMLELDDKFYNRIQKLKSQIVFGQDLGVESYLFYENHNTSLNIEGKFKKTLPKITNKREIKFINFFYKKIFGKD